MKSVSGALCNSWSFLKDELLAPHLVLPVQHAALACASPGGGKNCGPFLSVVTFLHKWERFRKILAVLSGTCKGKGCCRQGRKLARPIRTA